MKAAWLRVGVGGMVAERMGYPQGLPAALPAEGLSTPAMLLNLCLSYVLPYQEALLWLGILSDGCKIKS